MTLIENPIRRGFYPDPSICRVEHDYYCVHSSFAYAPGIPIFHSRNLVEWESLGHVLTRESQLCLEGLAVREGIYAPTIRYHEGVFYVIATNVGGGGCFYVTSTDPGGEWSEPHFLTGAEGIDPSLYFEGDRCYCIGQRLKAKASYSGACEIWARELDLKQHKLVGRTHILWEGSMKKSIWAEGPHIYKRGVYYYLLIAEGGTEYSHSICVARSRKLMGTYEGCPNNPVFTHRHLGEQYPVQNVGHGDLVETIHGDWYILMLGSRVAHGCGELGRETFLADVTWQQDWPVINAGEGRLRTFQEIKEREKIRPMSETGTKKKRITLQEAVSKELLIGLRQMPAVYAVETSGEEKRKSREVLNILFYPATLKDSGKTGFAGIRMEERDFTFKAVVTATYAQGQEAGLTCFYDEHHMVRLCIRYHKKHLEVCVLQHKKGLEMVLEKQRLTAYEGTRKRRDTLKIQGHGQRITCLVNGREIIKDLDISFLCDQQTGGFTGTVLAMYATSNHGQLEQTAGGAAHFSEIAIRFTKE